VDPDQHFETDLLGMDSAGTLDCDSGKCKMKHHQKNDFIEEVPYDYDLGNSLPPELG